MNKSYRLVWNSARNCLMIASETTKSQGKGSKSKKIALATIALAFELAYTSNSHAATWDPITDYNYIVDGTPLHPNINDGLTASSASVGSLVVMNTGSISVDSVSSNGVNISSSLLSGGIENAGLISGVDSGIFINSSTITRGITNIGSIRSDGDGVHIESSTLNGEIVNSGLISGLNSGIDITGSSIVGNIINSGNISVGGTGLRISNSNISGAIVNRGAISGGGVDSGIVLVNGSSLNGGIVNSGVISGGAGGNGILLNNASMSNGLLNDGAISGGNVGISLGNISNLSGGINNHGAISGGDIGIQLRSSSVVSGGIRNSGVISGGASGIAVGYSSITEGIENSGVITGGSRGIHVISSSSILGGITNSGLISGGVNSIYVEDSAALDRIIIAGNNTASFSGAVYAPNTTVTIANGATYTLNANFNVSNFSNAGTLIAPTALVAAPTITGSLTLQNSGTFVPTITAINNHAQVVVTGDVNISGALAINSPMMPLGSTLTGLITGNTVTGSFTSSSDISYLYNYVPVYTGTALNLVVSKDSSASFAQAVQSNGNSAGLGAAVVLDVISGSPSSSMAGLMSAFAQMKTAQQVSNAVSQTLPVIMGAASQAAAQNQQGLNQIMQARQNHLHGLSSGEDFIGNKDIWMKGYGSWANQGDINNVSGYKVNTGGLAIGIDNQVSPRANIGAVFAFGNSSVSSNSNVAPSGITVNSYQLGAYGDYALQHDLKVNYQADIGLNNNKSYRNLSDFSGVQGIGPNANATYNSAVAHVGAGLRHFMPAMDKFIFIPSARADFTTVQSQGYTETGGGALNLNANPQSYNMMLLSADLRMDYEPTEKLKFSVNVGGGYNTLNNQVQITSAYQGGGTAFVTNGLQTSPWIYNAGLGVSGRIDRNTELNLRYDNQFTTTNYSNQIVSARLKFWY